MKYNRLGRLLVTHLCAFFIGFKLRHKNAYNIHEAHNPKLELLRTVPKSERSLGFEPISQRLIAYIDQVQHHLYIAAYGFTHEGIIKAVERAANRGVKVHIAIDKQYVKDLTKKLKPLYFSKNKNIEIYGINLPGYGIAHDKYCMGDDLFTFTGSYNLTHNADTNNRENAIIIFDPKIAQTYKQYWNDGIRSSNAQLLKGDTNEVRTWEGMEEAVSADTADDEARLVYKEKAQECVYCMLKTMPSDIFLSYLIGLRNQGVDVQLITNKEIGDAIISKVGSNLAIKTTKTIRKDVIIIDHNAYGLCNDQLRGDLSINHYLKKFKKLWQRI